MAAISASRETTEPPVGRATATFLMVAFVGLIALPASWQMALDPAEQRDLVQATIGPPKRRVPTPEALARLGDDLARVSRVSSWARRYYQFLLTAGLDEGSRKVVIGHDGFLFLRDDLELCTGTAIFPAHRPAGGTQPAADHPSLGAILEYEFGMRVQDIHLIVVPVPVSPALYPEKIWPAYPPAGPPAWGPDYLRWKERLTAAGVDVCDVTDRLWQARHDAEAPWVKHNTHWSPRGVALAADQIAEHARRWLGPSQPGRYHGCSLDDTVGSDLGNMLNVAGPRRFPRVHCQTTQVFEGQDIARYGGDEASVLLLGDSYARYYGDTDSGRVPGADLGRQLMLRLQIPVQLLAEGGANPTVIRGVLAQRRQILTHKKVLIWEFTTRFLDAPNQWERVMIPRR